MTFSRKLGSAPRYWSAKPSRDSLWCWFSCCLCAGTWQPMAFARNRRLVVCGVQGSCRFRVMCTADILGWFWHNVTIRASCSGVVTRGLPLLALVASEPSSCQRLVHLWTVLSDTPISAAMSLVAMSPSHRPIIRPLCVMTSTALSFLAAIPIKH